MRNLIGKIIGNYQITSELARGGMGTVYRGRHLHLPREVVVKAILMGAYSPSAQIHLRARFRREAFIQSQLDHPNIVRVYEFFATDDNYYLVMEYVRGMSLKDLLAKQGVPTSGQAVYLCKQAVSALIYAHNFSYVDESDGYHTGIIHRDIKPANLLLNARGQLKITDFGIVKVTGDEALTQSGFQPGTVEYMSPEQLLGLDVDERTDIYCLGVTFYEMLTGRLPFPRSSTGSDWEVRKGHIEVDPPLIHNIRREIHPDLSAIIMRSLKKNPNERYQSASEFLEALQTFERRNTRTASGRLSTARLNIPSDPDPGQTQIVPPRQPFFDSGALPAQQPLETSMTIPLRPSLEFTDESPTAFVADTSPIEPRSNPTQREILISVPAGAPGKKWPLAVAAGILLTVSAAGVYLFSGQREAKIERTSAATTIEAALITQSPTPVQQGAAGRSSENNALKLARAFDEQERYSDAILKYEEYLRRNPVAADARQISNRLVTLRQFQGFLTAARTAMENKKPFIARQNYVEALRLAPESTIAKQGLAEADSMISANPLQERSRNRRNNFRRQ